MKRTTELRRLLKEKRIIVAPGVYDCLSAKLAEKAGFEMVMITGAGIVASVFGYPDMGLITMTEVLNQTRNIVRSVKIPVFADCDTGYGNPLNVFRTIQEFEDAGVAGLFIEDQPVPKRCGHFEGKQVIPMEEMIKKIEAALDARRDPDLVIMARTDARAVYGLDHAIERARAYVEAGADMIFIKRLRLWKNFGGLQSRFMFPRWLTWLREGKPPWFPFKSLKKWGSRLRVFQDPLRKWQ
jgi:2,3-dimethylmalate lyase